MIFKLSPDEKARLLSHRGRLEGNAIERPARNGGRGTPEASCSLCISIGPTFGHHLHGRDGPLPVVRGRLRSHGSGHRPDLRFWIQHLNLVKLVL